MKNTAVICIFLTISHGYLSAGYNSSIEQKNGMYTVCSGFSVEASSETVWEVLTDYENIDRFVRAIKQSRIEEDREGHILLRQKGEYRVLGIFPVKIELLLETSEESFRKISFRDIFGGDFKYYAGSWLMSEENGQVSVIYSLEAAPKFIDIGFYTKKVFGDMSDMMMDDIVSEIKKRKSSGIE